MKRINKIIILLLLLLFLPVGKTLALIVPGTYKKSKRQIITQTAKKTAYKNSQAYLNCFAHCTRFREKYGKKWKMQYNHLTGAIKSIWGYKTLPQAGKPEEAAKNFIIKNKDLFRINFDNLNLKETSRHKRYRHIKYRQTYQGIPVERGKVLVHLLADNSIVAVNSSYFTEIDLETKPGISKEKALALVKSDLQIKSIPLKTPQSILVVFPDREKEKYYLAWKVRIRLNNPLGDWICFVEANTGEILFKYNNLRFGTVSGMIFPNDGDDTLVSRPFAGEYVVVDGTITEITDENGYYSEGSGTSFTSQLTGPYVKVYNDDQPEVSISTDVASFTWSYLPADSETSEVNMFYHVNSIHRYFSQVVSSFTGVDYQMEAWVHNNGAGSDGAFNCYYDPSNGNIYFGDGGGVFGNFAHACDVIYHEYTHAVVHHIYELVYYGQSGAMDEALADYFAATYTEDSVIGDWVLPVVYQRDLSADFKKYPDHWVGEVHDDSLIYSGALWEFRTVVSSTTVNETIFDSLFFQPDSFQTGLQAILLADDDDNDLSNGTPNQMVIELAFANHGITLEDMNDPVADENDTYEPNNAFSESYDIKTGETLSSFISYSGDCDYYRVCAAPGNIRISLGLPFYNTDPWYGNLYYAFDISLFDSDHNWIDYQGPNEVFWDGYYNYYTPSPLLEINSRISQSDFYYIMVSGISSTSTRWKPYTLQVEFIPGGIQISRGEGQTVILSGLVEIGSKSIENIRVKDKTGYILTRGIDTSGLTLDGDKGEIDGIISLGDIKTNYPAVGTIYVEISLKNKWGNNYLTGPSNYLKTSASANKLILWNNVFNPVKDRPVTVRYELLQAGRVSIKIYNIAGELVCVLVDGEESEGAGSINWDGRNKDGKFVASGLYLVHIIAPGFKDTKKIVVVK